MFWNKKNKNNIKDNKDKINELVARVSTLEGQVKHFREKEFKETYKNGKLNVSINSIYKSFVYTGMYYQTVDPVDETVDQYIYGYHVTYQESLDSKIEIGYYKSKPISFAKNNNTILIKFKDGVIKRFEKKIGGSEYFEIEYDDGFNIKVFEFMEVG